MESLGKTCVMAWNFEICQAYFIYIIMTGVPCGTCSKKEDGEDKKENEQKKESTGPKVGT